VSDIVKDVMLVKLIVFLL